jgi:DNA-binding response OmpR family regulator
MAQEPYVLIADDDPLMIKSLQVMLRSAGFRVVAVTDGAAAFETARKDPPRVALLDVMMPRLDGLDVCRAIKSDAAMRHIKVFLLTARAMPRERQQGLDAGADDYITKPFAKADLLARLRAAFGADAPTPRPAAS